MHERAIYNSDHELFRTSARRFFREELEPNIDQWEKDGRLPREFWLKAGENGFHCCGVPAEYGCAGADFLYNMVLSEEVGFAIGGASVGFSVSSDIVAYYLLHILQQRVQLKRLAHVERGGGHFHFLKDAIFQRVYRVQVCGKGQFHGNPLL